MKLPLYDKLAIEYTMEHLQNNGVASIGVKVGYQENGMGHVFFDLSMEL